MRWMLLTDAFYFVYLRPKSASKVLDNEKVVFGTLSKWLEYVKWNEKSRFKWLEFVKRYESSYFK